MTKNPAFDQLLDKIYSMLGDYPHLIRLNTNQVSLIKYHILENWANLNKERPELFYERITKTSNLRQGTDKTLYQETIIEKIIPRDLLINPMIDSHSIVGIELKKLFLPIAPFVSSEENEDSITSNTSASSMFSMTDEKSGSFRQIANENEAREIGKQSAEEILNAFNTQES